MLAVLLPLLLMPGLATAAKPKRGNVPEVVVVSRSWPPIVSVRVAIGGGALTDPAGKEGQALLLWSTALRGAGDRDRQQFATALDALGAHLDVSVDKLGATLLGDVAVEQLQPFLQLVADAVLRPRLDPAELTLERNELLAQLQHLRDDDAALCDDALQRYVYRGQSLGRPTQGTAATLANLDAAQLTVAHKKMVVAGNVRVGLGGAIDVAQAQALVKAAFGELPAGTPPKMDTGKLVQDGRRVLLIDQPKRSQSQMQVALTTVAATHKDRVPLLVANAVLGGPFTSRITREVRELRGWAYSADSSLGGGPTVSTWTAHLGTATKDAVPALELVVKLFEELGRHGVTPAELKFAKDWLVGAHKLSLETADRELAYLMRGMALGMTAAELAAVPQQVQAVDLKTVLRVLKERLKPEHLIAVVVGPAKILADKLAVSAASFGVETIASDGQPELTRGAGNAVTSRPLPADASPTAPGDEPAEPDVDDVDDGADVEDSP